MIQGMPTEVEGSVQLTSKDQSVLFNLFVPNIIELNWKLTALNPYLKLVFLSPFKTNSIYYFAYCKNSFKLPWLTAVWQNTDM
jgi:hypothetical protein